MRRFIRRLSAVRFRNEEFCTVVGICQGMANGGLRRFQVLLRINGGDEERLCGIVEAFSSRAILLKSVTSVAVNAEQIPNGIGVLRPIQASYRRGCRGHSVITDGFQDRLSYPSDEVVSRRVIRLGL